ncbi:hypothetical protein Q3G72_030875 [Acer saccharum]|nr:hypothetical protein Q3G72_030875 [Acer saccharum]
MSARCDARLTTMSRLAADLDLVAQQLNTYFAARLGLPAPFAALAQDAPALVAAVCQIQRDCGHLLADGILGPKTRAYLQGEAQIIPQASTGYLIVDTKRCPTPFATTCFDQAHGLSFLDQPGWQPRDAPKGDQIDLCVLHWDECISSTHCFGVLLHRGLSVHLMLDADGMVYQALDLAFARAYHARIHNERSVGIEIQNAVLSREPQAPRARRGWLEEILPHTQTIFGHLDFTDAQKRTITKLVPWLCETLHIPKKLPTDALGQVVCGICPQPFVGVCGHYHLQTDKVDPGASLWPLLAPVMQAYAPIAAGSGPNAPGELS